MPPPRPPIIAPPCAATRATTSCSAAPSWRCWRTARSTRRSSSPNAFCRSTRPTASPGSCSGCARSSRSSIRSRAGNSPSRSAARSPISPRPCWRRGRMASPTEAKAATDSIDKLAGPDWYAIFKDLHAALILDLAGQKKDAAKRFERAYKLDPDRAARGAELWQLSVAAGQYRRGAEDIRHVRRGAAAPSADRWRRSPSSRPARSFR